MLFRNLSMIEQPHLDFKHGMNFGNGTKSLKRNVPLLIRTLVRFLSLRERNLTRCINNNHQGLTQCTELKRFMVELRS